ncbi:MAG: sensor of ECF-type sigma factor [Winogradskyella sp.]|nr:sensor of ECF-type sigma factor [Winogradskyella sp.]NNK40745.1 sensor of ECF-type sigma factor [Winogradskyella sp.]
MKQLITPILILMFTAFSFAQNGERMQERIKAQKIAFITEKLNLTPQEAQQFWPIYNKFEETAQNVKNKDLREIKNKMRSGGLSDREANALLDRLTEAETKMHNAKLTLVKDLRSVISAEKIIRLKAAEDEFNRKLLERLEQFRRKRQNRD